VQAQLPKRT